MKTTSYVYWGLVGLHFFQLIGFVTERDRRLLSVSIPLLLISILLIVISGYIDFSSARNNEKKPNPFFLLAPHISAIVGVLTLTYLGAYLAW